MIVNKKHPYIKIEKKAKVFFLMVLLLMALCGTIYANMYRDNHMKVNKENLPELDAMYVINSKIIGTSDNSIINEKNINIIEGEIKNNFGIQFLSSKLASSNPYIIEKIRTDNEDYAMITLENYILGDTSDFNYNKKDGFYSYKAGEKFFSPLSLQIDVILSEEQMNNGWDTEYLGSYKFEEQYVSKQGYRVNIVSSKIKENNGNNENSEKCAIFVADGIRYTLKGRTSLENIKAVIDTMEYTK